jgi:hypothetical protein
MTSLPPTSILEVSILLQEVKVPCFVSKSAWVIPPVIEIILLAIVMLSPAVQVSCFLIKALSTYILEASFSCAFIAACNPAVLAKVKTPSFITSCFVS